MSSQHSAAISDFRQARRRAGLEQLLARITGKPTDLLPFEEVRRKLRASSMVARGLREVPVDAIVGSVGRYRDFTRSFLPLSDEDADRWASVKIAQETKGVPPITVYQVDEAYFVLDGNHRVSIARQMGTATIEAYVTEVQTNVPLTPDVQADDLIVKAEYAEFLSQTRLDRLRPDGDLSLTAPGKYPLLLEHIQVHHYYLGLEQQRDIPYEEGLTGWYDNVYLPTAELIEESGLLHDFPQRTVADLYLWLTEHRARIEDALGWKVKPTRAVADLMDRSAEASSSSVVSRMFGTSDMTGTSLNIEQHVDRLVSRPDDHLFEIILVPISREETSWAALDQAFTVAQRESGQIRGLLAVRDEAEIETLMIQALQQLFLERCAGAGVPGKLLFETQSLADAALELARWVDLIVLAAPGGEPRDTGLRRLMQSVPTPILLLPDEPTALQHALLLFDGRWASQASLAAACYMAQRWSTILKVLVAPRKGDDEADILEQLEATLSRYGIDAEKVVLERKHEQATMLAATVYSDSDLVLWGGSGKGALAAQAAVSGEAGHPLAGLPQLLFN